MRRNLEPELAPDLPGLLVVRKVDLAAHDHGDELVGRGEPLLLDADSVVRILVAGIAADNSGTRALEIAEGGTAPGIEQCLDGGVRVLGRVMDLRDVVHRRDAVIELAQAPEQLVDVHVLRTVLGGEREENEFEVSGVPARGVRPIVDKYPVGEEAAQHGLELVVVRIDEARHDDAAAGVDRRGTAHLQIRPDRKDLLALDQHVGLGKIAHVRVHRHHGTTTNDVAPAVLAAVLGWVPVVRRGRARREQIETCGGAGGRRSLQEIAP